MAKQDKSFTLEDFKDIFGWECELCSRFDMDNSICLKGRKPRKYFLEDGPNEECHAIRYCMDFKEYFCDNSEDIATGVRNAFDCGIQQYC